MATGTSLWSVLDMLRRLQHLFPQVDIKYDPDSSSNTPVILHVRPHLDLLFSGKHQRLRTICLRKLRDPNPPVILRYKDTILSSTEEVLRRVGVSRTFGPTYPGEDLRYPGLWFSFEEDGMGEGLKRTQSEDRMQEVKRVIVSQKEADIEGEDALSEVLECPAMDGDISLAAVKVRRTFRGYLPILLLHFSRSAMVSLFPSILLLIVDFIYVSARRLHKISLSSLDSRCVFITKRMIE